MATTPPNNPIYGAQCAPIFGNTYDTCGGSFSRSQLTTLNEAGIKALFTDALKDGSTVGTKFNENGFVLKHQFEMALCGVKRNGFYDWITGSGRSGMSNLLSFEKRDRGPMILRPFIIGRQQSVVNADYYSIVDGYTTTRADTGAGTAKNYPTTGPLSNPALTATGTGGRVIRVMNAYGAGNILDAGRFLADMSVASGNLIAGGHATFVLNTIGSSVAATTQWRIVDAANAADGTYVDVALALAGDQTAGRIDVTPIKGVVINGINNVADVEQYCKNPSNYTNTKFVPFWFQTYRETRCVDSEYLRVQKQLLQSNEYFQQFVDLPEAERNRQDEERSQREFVHSFLFGRAYNSSQTKDNWGSLPDITSVAKGNVIDPGVGAKLITKRANMIGVYDQLRSCGSGTGQVFDSAGAPLNFTNYLETLIYGIYRARQTRGSKSARNITVWTDSTTANDFAAAWIQYVQKKTGLTTATLTWNAEEMDRNDPKALMGFTWRTYKLFKPSGIALEIVTHETFDDLRDMFVAADAGSPHRGKFLLALDLGSGGTIHPATLASNRKVYTVGELDQLAKLDTTYSCVMEAPTQVKTLTSKTVTAIVSCPLESLWVENFNGFTVP